MTDSRLYVSCAVQHVQTHARTDAPAEVDEVAVAVDGGEAAVGDLVGDDGGLEGVVLEQLQRLLLRHHQPLERLMACV